jgi:hypothetical protein
MCIFRYAMSISSSLTHIFALSRNGSTYHFFFAVFMFYAAIKTTREQHNIIRYVLKILTKKQNLTPCCENHIGSPHVDRALFSPPLRFFRRFLISAFAIQIRNMLVFCGPSNASLSLLLISIAQIYSNKDKLRIIIYQFICFNLCLFSGSFCT